MNTEALLIKHLSSKLAADGIRAYGDVPSARPKTFVTVERLGGSVDQFVDRASLAVQAWESSRARAAALADRLVGVVESAVLLPEVAGAEVSTLYNFPDPDSRQARYQLVVHLHVMRF